MEKLSVFVTTFNNARTLEACLRSVAWADEVVVLDSFSTDRTAAIADAFGCRFDRHRFLGYGPQKRLAMAMTRHRWVLLLDADEMLSPELAGEIRALLAAGPRADGYAIPRLEQVFWRMTARGARLNHHLRLFDKSKARISDIPVHAAPEIEGRVARLRHVFYHFGEVDIHTKVDKINHYSTGLVGHKRARGRTPGPLRLILYPPLVFLRSYLLKRAFLSGWAGFVSSVVNAFYVFLKYAKPYERAQFEKHGRRFLPEGAPPMPWEGGAGPGSGAEAREDASERGAPLAVGEQASERGGER